MAHKDCPLPNGQAGVERVLVEGADECGGVGAVWIKTLPDRPGRIRVAAAHATLGKKTIDIEVASPQ